VWAWLRVLLRVVAVALLAVAVYLIVMQPSASVASENLLSKVDLGVRCSSVWSQWTNHAKPAALVLNGQPLTSVPQAQSSCASASTTIKRAAGGSVATSLVLTLVSFFRRRSERTG
jgi:hypothetical protein